MQMTPKLRSSLRPSPGMTAIVLSIVLVLWLLSGEKLRAKEDPPEVPEKPSQLLDVVETRWSTAEPVSREQVIQGGIKAWQQVDVRAQVAGRIDKLLKQQGETAKAGEALLQISDEGRASRLAQAQADVRLRRSELDGGRSLQSGNLVSKTELSRLESELAKAQADLVAAELAVKYGQPEAPFAGRVDRRHVELGQWVQVGDPVMTLVDVARLKVTGQIPQQQAAEVAPGQAVIVKLLDGRELRGVVHFVSYAADPSTRSFYVEAHVDNSEQWRVAGGSGAIHIQLPSVKAHRISPALLSLDGTGHMGVHVVEQGVVVFYRVQVVSIDGSGAVVTGLPERVELITQGAGFVQPGQVVQTRGAAQ